MNEMGEKETRKIAYNHTLRTSKMGADGFTNGTDEMVIFLQMNAWEVNKERIPRDEW